MEPTVNARGKDYDFDIPFGDLDTLDLPKALPREPSGPWSITKEALKSLSEQEYQTLVMYCTGEP